LRGARLGTGELSGGTASGRRPARPLALPASPRLHLPTCPVL